ncbi:hypothetical protein ACSQ67_006453 [Phaseolus vulgaris]
MDASRHGRWRENVCMEEALIAAKGGTPNSTRQNKKRQIQNNQRTSISPSSGPFLSRTHKISGTAMAAVHLFFFLLLLSLLPLSLPLTDNQALLALKKSFSNPQTLPSWIPDQNPCSARWVGVICLNNGISSIHLTDLSLSGSIDIEALSQIPSLRSISFVNNSFSGPIPPFNKLGVLKALYLTNNQFSGPIPSDFFSQLASLKKIWLSYNKFTGPIPESITNLRFLSELHLENNQFSGRVPELKQDIKSLDMSHNNLQGQIPSSMSRFDPKSFSENKELCGKPLAIECESEPKASESTGWGLKVVILIFIAAVLAGAFVIMRSKRQRDDDFSVMSRDNAEEVVQVHVPSTNHSRGTSEGSKKESSTTSKKGARAVLATS